MPAELQPFYSYLKTLIKNKFSVYFYILNRFLNQQKYVDLSCPTDDIFTDFEQKLITVWNFK